MDSNCKYGHSEIRTPCDEVNKMKGGGGNLTFNLLVGIDGMKNLNFIDGPSDMVHFMNFFFEPNESVLDDGWLVIPPESKIVVNNAAIHHNEADQF